MTVRSMGKVRFRLWFHKLNIKGFRRKRRLPYPPPHHGGPSSPALHSCFPVSAHTLPISHHRGLHQLSNASPPPNVLLSPINRKAMDLPYPAACSSSPPPRSFKSPALPAAALSSPSLPAAPGSLDSPAASAHPLIFRSPAANHTLNDRVKANRSARAGRSIMSSKDDNMQGLLVDCGCRPNLASSFRKTKETLQACGGGSGSFCKGNSAHHSAGSPAPQQLANAKQYISSRRRDGVEDPFKKGPVNSGQEQSWERAETWSVVAKTDDHSDEVLQKKVVLKRRKKKMDPTPANPLCSKQKLALKTPVNEPNLNNTGIQKAMKSGLEDVNHGQGDMKLSSSFRLSTSSRDATVLDSRSNFGWWDKEFPSFTSEDTFFSSLERGRPSFSSNSSSEYFDRKLNLNATFASNQANSAPKNHAKLPCNDAVLTPKKPSIKGSEDVQDSTKRDGLDVAEKGVQFHHDLRGSKHASPLAGESYHGDNADGDGDNADGDGVYSIEGTPSSVEANENSFGANSTRACISTNHSKKSHSKSLVGIKEDCEESNMGARLSNSGRSNSVRAMPGVQEVNDEANLMSSPNFDYYYHRVQADPHRSERTRRKNTRREGAPNALIRRAQLQARWKLSEEQVQWQSSDDDEYGSCSSTSISSHGVDNQNRLITTRRRRRRRQRETSKQGEFNAATLAVSKAAPNMLNNCAAEAMSSSISSENFKDSSRHTNYAANTRLTESVAVVKCSEDPLADFRDSMVDMILEKQIYSADELEELLQCFLSLNSREHHDTIVRAFTQVWEKDVFANRMAASLR